MRIRQIQNSTCSKQASNNSYLSIGTALQQRRQKAAAELVVTHPAAELEEDPERRQDNGEDDVDAGRRAVRHLAFLSVCSV